MLVVDCAPTAETLRLLSLPEVMNWYIERIFPVERRVVKTIRPMLSRMTSLPIAGDQVFAAVERLHRNLDAVKQILTDENVSSVRLVVNPEKMVIAEARRTYTYLGLFGYRVDAVVVNRIIPEEVIDPYFGKWKDIQAEHLADRPRVVRARPHPDRAAVRSGDGRAPPARGDGRRGLRRARRDRHPVPRRPDRRAGSAAGLRAVDAPAVRRRATRWTSTGAARSCSSASARTSAT